MKVDYSNLVEYSLRVGERVLSSRTQRQRKRSGQFLTPAKVARFMARQLGPIGDGDRVLDPAIGSGTLICAVIERAIAAGQPTELWVEGYEVDGELGQAARDVLKRAAEIAASRGVTIHTKVRKRDFVLDSASAFQSKLPFLGESITGEKNPLFTHVIANPPYFKLKKSDPRVQAMAGKVKGYTNIYTLFVALSIRKLLPDGQACFIIPRSFCSGAYFSAFRRELVEKVTPLHVHLFESRERIFEGSAVLQENVIFAFRKQCQDESGSSQPYVNISASQDLIDLGNSASTRQVAIRHFIGKRFGTFFLRLPTSELDEQFLDAVDNWTGSLAQYGLDVSTGPIVAFRAKDHLVDLESVEYGQAIPLLWMHNVNPYRVVWPATNGSKPQGILLTARDEGLLVPRANYVLLRRFSAKEEPRRLISAPFLAEQYEHDWIGLENHLNYVHSKQGKLQVEEALGLTALFNSALIDRYFRIINGNTQVNATELRSLPLPPMEVIRRIGERVEEIQKGSSKDANEAVFLTLYEYNCLDESIPIIEETRFEMGKIQEAQEVLAKIGMPPAQQNEISALTLLALAQLSEETPWNAAQTRCLRIHDVLGEIKNRYGREYAENMRETIRRQVLHQFIQAGIAVPNPDEPGRPTNSPHFCYALTDLALRTVKAYSSEQWGLAVQSFRDRQDALIEVYQKRREQHKVHLRLKDGETYSLSPRKHNQLQVAIVEEFGPRFVPGGTLVYLGDTANRTVILEESVFAKLGVPSPSSEKMPDVVIYDEERDWLFLVEAVTSHGPVSPKRHFELEEMLSECSAGRVYVTAFPDLSTFKSFIADIAWETEVWIAEMPEHLIHFDGERFLKPHIS